MTESANRRQLRVPCTGLTLGVLSLALLASGAAQAQVTGSYQTTSRLGTFVEMTDGIPVGLQAKTAMPNGKTIQLGFPMVFYGQTYTEVFVNSQGLVLFGGTSLVRRPANSQLGDPAPPNGWVSPWFPERTFSTIDDDQTTYKIEGPPGARVATIQWKDWGELYQGGIDWGRMMQVRLEEATRKIVVVYGPKRATSSWSSVEWALAGMEDPNGANPVSFLLCNSNTGSGSNPNRGCNGDKSWPAEGTTLEMTWLTPEADLVPEVKVTGVRPVVVNSLDSLEVDLDVTIHNLGNTDAHNVVFDVYASDDPFVDPFADTFAGNHATPITVAARASETVSTTVTFLRPTGNEVYVGVDLDPIGAVDDAARHNNRGVSSPIVVGVDLRAISVSGPSRAGLGDTVELTMTVENLGSDPTNATYGLYLSSDEVVDPSTDVRVGETTLSLNGFERKTVTVQARIPRNFYINNSAELYWGLYADPAHELTSELTRDNNGIASIATWNIVLPELTAENLTVTRTEYFFGEFASFSGELMNEGEGDAHDVTVWIVLSDNPSMTLSDHPIAQIDNLFVPKNGKATFSIDQVRLPTLMMDGVTPYPTGVYHFGILVDPMREIPETNEQNNGKPFQPEVHIRQPAPDFAAVRVDAPTNAAGGEVIAVSRLIRNIGNRGNDTTGRAYRYQYFLSENDVISVQDWPLPILIDGKEEPFAFGRLAAGAEDRAIDLLRLPSNLPAGDYFLGLLVDPSNEIVELDESNNLAISGTLVRVIGDGLNVVSTWLPDATAGVAYVRQLVARGGTGTYEWSLVPGGGELPRGVTLSADGTLAGKPEEVGISEFVVQVKSGELSALARLFLRVYEPTGVLQISTTALPLGVVGKPYGGTGTDTEGVDLVASGGVPPYQWRLLGLTSLPNGVVFSDGRLIGTPATGTEGNYSLDVEVQDAAGSTARQQLPLKVITPATLAFDTVGVPPDGVAGGTYTLAIPVVGAQGALKVSVTEGAIPEGLQLSAGSDRVFLLGTAMRPGAYPFVLTVTDDTGATASRSLLVMIKARSLEIVAQGGSLPDAKPGTVYDSYLTSNASTKVSWSLAGGELPPGLELQPDGAIRGTVPEGTPGRTWNFLVEARDQNGGQGIAPFSIYVEPPPSAATAAPKAVGCSSATGSAAPAGLLALAALLRRSGRRRESVRE